MATSAAAAPSLTDDKKSLADARKTKAGPAIKRSFASSGLASPPPPSRASMNKALARDGYCVLRNVLSEDQCVAVETSLWNYMEALSPAIKRDDLATLTPANRPIHTRGLIQHYNVGFQEASVLVRQWAKPVFAELYGTQELWTSVDGLSLSTKPKRCHYKDQADWNKNHWERDPVHVDQTTVTDDGKHSCVQGGFAITSQHADEHVFLCVPGSHVMHAELLALGPAKKKLHWEIMNDSQKELMKHEGLEMKRVPLNRGDAVLWDSRVVHSSSPYLQTAPAGAKRIQVFACMLPVSRVPAAKRADQMAKRQKAYDQGVVSKHSPDLIRLFGKLPQTYGADQSHFTIPASVTMTPAERQLHGLAHY